MNRHNVASCARVSDGGKVPNEDKRRPERRSSSGDFEPRGPHPDPSGGLAVGPYFKKVLEKEGNA